MLVLNPGDNSTYIETDVIRGNLSDASYVVGKSDFWVGFLSKSCDVCMQIRAHFETYNAESVS